MGALVLAVDSDNSVDYFECRAITCLTTDAEVPRVLTDTMQQTVNPTQPPSAPSTSHQHYSFYLSTLASVGTSHMNSVTTTSTPTTTATTTLPPECPDNMVLVGFLSTTGSDTNRHRWYNVDQFYGICRKIIGLEVDKENCDNLGVMENGEWPGGTIKGAVIVTKFIYCPEDFVAVKLIRDEGGFKYMTCCAVKV